jgi:hypothetical protein
MTLRFAFCLKLRFALPFFGKIEVDNLLVTFPAGLILWRKFYNFSFIFNLTRKKGSLKNFYRSFVSRNNIFFDAKLRFASPFASILYLVYHIVVVKIDETESPFLSRCLVLQQFHAFYLAIPKSRNYFPEILAHFTFRNIL